MVPYLAHSMQCGMMAPTPGRKPQRRFTWPVQLYSSYMYYVYVCVYDIILFITIIITGQMGK